MLAYAVLVSIISCAQMLLSPSVSVCSSGQTSPAPTTSTDTNIDLELDPSTHGPHSPQSTTQSMQTIFRNVSN